MIIYSFVIIIAGLLAIFFPQIPAALGSRKWAKGDSSNEFLSRIRFAGTITATMGLMLLFMAISQQTESVADFQYPI